MRIRRSWISAAVLAVLTASSVAQAGEATGLVTNLNVRNSDSLTYVYLSTNGTARPPCASSTAYWMLVNEASETGKKLYATLLTAKVSGQQVRIIGKNTCARWG